MKNLLTQWETKEKNLRINLIKNLLTQWETKKEDLKTGGNVPLINREQSGNVLLLDSKHSGDVLLINRKLVELENDAECKSFLKLTELVKKPSNLTRTGKEKPHCPISHSLSRFIEPIRCPRFYFIEDLAGLTDGLAIGGAELRGEEIAVGFFG